MHFNFTVRWTIKNQITDGDSEITEGPLVMQMQCVSYGFITEICTVDI